MHLQFRLDLTNAAQALLDADLKRRTKLVDTMEDVTEPVLEDELDDDGKVIGQKTVGQKVVGQQVAGQHEEVEEFAPVELGETPLGTIVIDSGRGLYLKNPKDGSLRGLEQVMTDLEDSVLGLLQAKTTEMSKVDINN